jgi:heme/copper-type cytochrome/quinol oxidase subunit 2
VQNTIFWLTGAAFFAVQLAMLLSLLRREPRMGDPAADRRRRVEIVWTMVPASLIAALALMIAGLTASPWTRTRTQTVRLATPSGGEPATSGSGAP